jgi:hypothetical protein
LLIKKPASRFKQDTTATELFKNSIVLKNIRRRCDKEFYSAPNLSHVNFADVGFQNGVLDESVEHALENEVPWDEFGSCTFTKCGIPLF